MKDLEDLTIVVVPVYEDLDSLKILVKELHEKYQGKLYLVIVDDCSVKDEIVKENCSLPNLRGEIITLAKNSGHQSAIALGLNYIHQNLKNYSDIVVMDSDGEDRPLFIKTLKNKLNEKKFDIVVSSRKSRKNPSHFKIFYFFYKIIFLYITGRKINFGNFMILNKKALEKLVKMKDLHIHLAACVLISNIGFHSIPSDRGQRYRGESKMNLSNLFLHAIRSFVVLDSLIYRRILLIFLIASILVVFLILSNYFFSSPNSYNFIYILIILSILLIHLIFYRYLNIYRTKFSYRGIFNKAPLDLIKKTSGL